MNFLNVEYPIVTNPSWNVVDISKLKTFFGCKRRFFFEYILGWRPENSNLDLVFGTSWHLSTEYLLQNDYEQESVERGFGLFLSEFRKSFYPEHDVVCSPKNPKRAREGLQIYAGKWWNDLDKFEVLETEKSGVTSIGEEFEIAYKIDATLRDRERDSYLFMEHKTSKNYSDLWLQQWDLSLQIGTYFHVGNMEYGKGEFEKIIVSGSFFRKVKDDSKAVRFHTERVDCYRTDENMLNWLNTVKRGFESLEREMELLSKSEKGESFMRCFEQNPGNCQDFARRCPYKDFCLFWANPLKKVEELPVGMKVEFWNPLEESE